MPRLSASLALIAALWLTAAPAVAQSAARTPPVRATGQLLLNTDAVRPGQQGIAAVVVDVVNGWHTQSSRPLDSAFIPFVVTMTATGNTVEKFGVHDALYAPGEVHDFPALGGKLSVYEGRVLTFVPFVVPADAKPGDEVTFEASVRYQACNDQTCDRPTTMKLAAKATVAAEAKTTNNEVFARFDPMRYLHEHPLPGDASSSTQPTTAPAASSEWVKYSDAALATARAGGKPVIVKFTAAWCVNCHVVERRVFGDAGTLAKLSEQGVTLIKADLTADGAPGSELLAKLNPSRSIPFTAVYLPPDVKLPEGKEAATLEGIYSSEQLLAAVASGASTGWDFTKLPLYAKLAIALGVGVLLNVVPCVLPVLPLKAMSFYEDAGHDRRRSIVNGLLFSAGIVVTFGMLAAFVISQATLWGKLISHPVTAVILTVVLLAAAAQSFGLFEFQLPRFVTNLEGSAAGGSSPIGQFFGGVLIAVLSTPCTIGPFAGIIAAAIALGLPLGPVLLMFVGVGMALPWLVLSAFPEATRKFPRTGPWPGVVKQMTGFLLVATAIFFAAPLVPGSLTLLWWLIFACVALAGVFLMARTVQLAPRPRPLAIAGVVSLALVGVGLWLTLAVVG